MGKTKEDFCNEDVDIVSNKKNITLLLPILLIINIILITLILIVSALWASVRNNVKMTMIPAPNMDRSLCIPDQDSGTKCTKILPEQYITDQIDKKLRKSHMTYMTEKLNYANVVCRNKTPSVYMFKGLSDATHTMSKNLIWKTQNQESNSPQESIKYNYTNGLVEIIRKGAYFVYSQITEKVENLRNQTVFTIRKKSNGIEEKLMESIGGACNLIHPTSKRSHYVGSAFDLLKGDILFASHSNPIQILPVDSFLGIRELS